MLFLPHRMLRSFSPYGWILAAVATHGTTVTSSLHTKSHTNKKKIHGKSLRTRKYKGTYGKKDVHKPSAAKSEKAQGGNLYLRLGGLLLCVIAVGYSLLQVSEEDDPINFVVDFGDFTFGTTEVEYENSLGPLEDVPLTECELNPDILKVNVHANVDLSKYSTKLDQAQKKILNLFDRANFSEKTTFANAKDEKDDGLYSKAKTLKDLQDFAEDMKTKPNLKNKTKQMLNRVIDQLHQLDIGQDHQKDGDLTPKQRTNRLLAHQLLPNIPVIQAGCHATTVSFVNRAGSMLKLNTLGTSTFTGSTLSYLQGQFANTLDNAIHEFLPMRRAQVRGETLKKAKAAYWQGGDKTGKKQQHLMNGLKAGCAEYGYIKASTGADSMNSPYAFTGDLDKHNRNAPDAINQKQLVDKFMQYYKQNFLTPQSILDYTSNAIIYSGIPAKYYQAFAKKKGFNGDILNDDGTPNQDVLRKFLLNIKVFQRKW